MTTTLFSPSAYTAALIFYLHKNQNRLPLNNDLEMGIGSGVVLTSALQLGAVPATGIDIENTAVIETLALLVKEGLNDRVQLACGDMWSASVLYGQKFDLIISNLPQFATEGFGGDGHLTTWSAGGADGRRVLDSFLNGVPEHLAENGCAVITHNVFLDLEKTQALLTRLKLEARVVQSLSVPLSPEKLRCMDADTLKRDNGRGVRRVGDCWFVDFDVLEITWKH